MQIEYFGQVSVYFGLGVEIITACILGGLIGFDREQKMKSAGIKTNMLICLGATLYTAISHLNSSLFGGPADPNRMAAQVVSGIGFLGAGAIIQGRGNIIGLTTAATIWVVAAIGVTIGSGFPIIATIFTLTFLVVLRLLGPMYRLFELKRDFKNYHMEVLSKGSVKKSVREIILHEVNSIHELSEEIIDAENNERIINVYFTMHPRKMKLVSREIKDIIQVEKVNFHITDYTGSISKDKI